MKTIYGFIGSIASLLCLILLMGGWVFNLGFVRSIPILGEHPFIWGVIMAFIAWAFIRLEKK